MKKAERHAIASARVAEYNYRFTQIEDITRQYWKALKDLWKEDKIPTTHDIYKAFYGRGLLDIISKSWMHGETPEYQWIPEIKQLNKEVYRDRPRIEETVEQTRMEI